MRDALDLPDDPIEVAERIRDGREHRLDLILCDEERKAFVCGLGVEGGVLKRREELQEDGKQGFTAYAAALASVFGEMDRTEMTLSLDGETLEFSDVATAIVTKIPYYGYKMKVVPEAVFDDGFLYLRVLDEGWPQILAGLAKARLVGSESETTRRAKKIEIKTQKEEVPAHRRQRRPRGGLLPLSVSARGPANVVLSLVRWGSTGPDPDQELRRQTLRVPVDDAGPARSVTLAACVRLDFVGCVCACGTRKPPAVRSYVIARSAVTKQSRLPAWEIASLRSQ